MSYDLVAFDRKQAPKDRIKFFGWIEKQFSAKEGHDYHSPDVTTPALRAWLMDMAVHFPPQHGDYCTGPQECDDEDAPDSLHISDYSIGFNIIHASFAWSLVDEAYETAVELATKHGVGLYDFADEIIMPGGLKMS